MNRKEFEMALLLLGFNLDNNISSSHSNLYFTDDYTVEVIKESPANLYKGKASVVALNPRKLSGNVSYHLAINFIHKMESIRNAKKDD